MEQYVSLSEGRVSKALDAMRDGLRLGYVVQSDTLISGLVGVAIDAISLNETARHYDQFSVRDCTQAIAIAREWLLYPNPALRVLTNEHRLNIRLLQESRNDLPRLKTLLDDGTDPNEPAATESQLAHKELVDYVAAHPDAVPSIVDQVIALSNAAFDATMADLKKPAWERKTPPKREVRATMADRLRQSFMADFDLIVDKYMMEVARVHLLGAHAAIHRYKWEYNALPGSLEELKAADLTTDPYTGKPLVYKVTGETYELYNVGGPYRDDNGQVSATQHVPVYLPHR